MTVYLMAAPIYIMALIVAFGMGIKKGVLFICFLLGVSFLLYLMFFHSTESAIGIVAIGVITYLLSNKK
ncbi:MAG TPA: hypothetical protein VN040_00045 [Pseudosphingobacterium sp.]|nr:hypothetical protein [Pseudosphingobacterium sp.]